MRPYWTATTRPRRDPMLIGACLSTASLSSLPAFQISPSPSANSTYTLFLDLCAQALGTCDLPLKHSNRDGERRSIGRESGGRGIGHSIYYKPSVADFQQQFLVAQKRHGEQLAATIILISSSPPAGHDKLWGSYAMPTIQSPTSLLRKRSSDSTHHIRRADTSPLPGILPACFPSLSACNSATRNCTGHGECSLAYKDSTAGDESPNRRCYACTCSPTKVEGSDGKTSTQYWGGPACQKKDISVQFWMIVLFTVGLVGLVSFAIGQVWSMGDEELPSVIGAGVSGPVARR